jgi:PhnB protein
MKEVVTYLNFDGNCREAMTFYAKCLGGDLTLTPFSEMPGNHPPEAKDRIMHARVSRKGAGLALLMASDRMLGMPFQQGAGFSISIMCESAEEVDRLFAALGEGGKITMPLRETFWAARFGALTGIAPAALFRSCCWARFRPRQRRPDNLEAASPRSPTFPDRR